MATMTNVTFDRLKKTALVVLPALATLYGAVATIWNIPYGQEVVLTITAVDVFLGAVLGVKSKQHRDQIEAEEADQ